MDVLIAAGAGSWESAALAFVENEPRLHLSRRCVDAIDVLAAAPDVPDAIALIDPDLVGLDADIVWKLVSAGTRVYLVCPVAPEDARVAALAESIGATGSVMHDELGQILAPRESGQKAPAESAHGQIVAIWGPAGAPGRTTLAMGVADQFAASDRESVLLVDADPYGGAVAPALGVMDEVSGLLAAIRAANNGQRAVIEQSAYRVGRMGVLTGLPHARMWMNARPAGFAKILREAKQNWSTTVIDTGFSLEDEDAHDSLAPRRNQLTRLGLEAADRVIVCGSADPVGLSRLVRGLDELHDAIPACHPIVVVNRFRASLGWRRREIAETVQRLSGIRPQVFIPYDLRTLDHAAIEGRTVREVDPECDLVSGFAALSGLCRSDQVERSDRADQANQVHRGKVAVAARHGS